MILVEGVAQTKDSIVQVRQQRFLHAEISSCVFQPLAEPLGTLWRSSLCVGGDDEHTHVPILGLQASTQQRMLSAVYIQLQYGMYYAVGCRHKYIQLQHGLHYAVGRLYKYIQLHDGMHYAVGCLHKYIQLHHGVCYAVSGLHTTAPWCVLCCQVSTYNCTMVCAMLSAVCIQLHHGVCYAVSCLHTIDDFRK